MAGKRKRFNYRIAAEGVIFVALMWAVLVGAALLYGHASWPNAHPPAGTQAALLHMSVEEQWESLLTVGLIVSALLIKCFAMARRQCGIDALMVSLVSLNVAFALVYLYVELVTIYPDWTLQDVAGRRLLRWPLIATAIFAIVELCMIEDPDTNWNGETERRIGPPERRGLEGG